MVDMRASLLIAPILALTLGTLTPAAAASSPWQWPLPGGRDVIRDFEPHSPFGPGHRGVDLPAAPGTPVSAVADGVISFTGIVAGRPVLTVAHLRGTLRSTVEPVEALVSAGDAVRRGQVIGIVGTGGHCSQICLHLGMRQGDRYLNPLTVLRGFAALKPSGSRVGLIEGRAQTLDGDVRVALGGGKGRVAEHLLHRPQIGTTLEHVGGRRVSHPVRRDVRHTGRRGQGVHDRSHGAGIYAATAHPQEQRGGMDSLGK